MSAAIVCPSCGKNYTYRAELAGKKVKCKCGQVIPVPASPPHDDGGLYDLAPDPELAKATAAARKTVMPRQQSGDACPECQTPLEPGSVICVQCGFNLKTGQKLAGVAAAGAAAKKDKPARATRFAGVPAHIGAKKVAEESRADVLKRYGLILGVVLVVVGLIFAMMLLGRNPQSDAAVLDPDDPAVTKSLTTDFSKEAREWLKTDSTWIMSGMTTSQAENRIDEWYRMGAKKVYCFGTMMAREVAIELPDDPAQRKALFDWQAKWHKEMGQRVRTDKGQKYLIIMLRL